MSTILHRTTLLVCVLAGALALAVALVAAARDASAAPPEPIPFPHFTVRGACDFPVLVESSGRIKYIDLPNGDFLVKYPGDRITLTNKKDPTHQLTYVATGTVHVTELENGDLLLVTTGRSVFLIQDKNIGILVPIGRFTTVIDEKGNFSPPTGHGRLIDACARLA